MALTLAAADVQIRVQLSRSEPGRAAPAPHLLSCPQLSASRTMEARWVRVGAERPGSRLGGTDVGTHQCFSSRTIKEQGRTTMTGTGGGGGGSAGQFRGQVEG